MEVDADYLRQRYSLMGTEELIELQQDGNLTELASNAINEILNSRGISNEQRTKPNREFEKPNSGVSEKNASKGSFFSAEGFAAGLLSLAAFQLYFLPLLQLGNHLGKRLTAFLIGFVASLVMFGALRFAAFLAIKAQNACPNNWTSCLAGGSIAAYLLFFLFSAWLIIGVMDSPYMGVAYSLGVFLIPIAIASFRGKWLAIISVGIFVMGLSYAHLPWSM